MQKAREAANSRRETEWDGICANSVCQSQVEREMGKHSASQSQLLF